MNATQRGAIIFGGLIVFLLICSTLTFSVLPGGGTGVAVPVITVPGEPYQDWWPSEDFFWTNTMTAILLADIFVLAFAFFAWRVSNGWTKEVPGRFQAWVELIGEFIYDQTRSFIGEKPLGRQWVFPLAATIFVFLLAVNWMKLLPGVESVGIFHCAGESNARTGVTTNGGYPKIDDRLWVSQPLQSPFPAGEHEYHLCQEFKKGSIAKPGKDVLIAAANDLEVVEAGILEDEALTPDERTDVLEAARLEATETAWDHEVSVGLSARELEAGVVPYLFVVTPFVRGGSTDLNLTIGLALVVVVFTQIIGVAAQGPDYFQKFVNLRALGQAREKPLGIIDFVVGLFEIISEIGKIISLAFRLFGNLFAGGILLIVMAFLVAFILPMVFYGLELIITTIQAFVFAILTIVYASQAMESHHGDDHDEHHDDHAGQETH